MRLHISVAAMAAVLLAAATGASAATPNPYVAWDNMTGTDDLGRLTIPLSPIQDHVEPAGRLPGRRHRRPERQELDRRRQLRCARPPQGPRVRDLGSRGARGLQLLRRAL